MHSWGVLGLLPCVRGFSSLGSPAQTAHFCSWGSENPLDVQAMIPSYHPFLVWWFSHRGECGVLWIQSSFINIEQQCFLSLGLKNWGSRGSRKSWEAAGPHAACACICVCMYMCFYMHIAGGGAKTNVYWVPTICRTYATVCLCYFQ